MNRPNEKLIIPVVSCKFVAGAQRALVIDLHRNTFQLIPLQLKELVDEYQGKPLKTLYEDFTADQHETLNEYLDFLLQEEFIFLSDQAEDAGRFMELPAELSHYNLIDNAIIDIGRGTQHNISRLITELTALGCEQIQVRAFREMDIAELCTLAEQTAGTECRNIEFIVPFLPAFKTADWETLLNTHLRIGGITCHSAPHNGTDWFQRNMVPVSYTTAVISSEQHCGVVHPRYFAGNQPHYLESLQHNTCLNRKIAVDAAGYIKNCPSMRHHYGHVDHTSLKKALLKEGFRAYWRLAKDDIQTCRDCEYRHVCTDCRAYLSDPGNLLSKPLKCGYDPYTATWADWASNPLKEAAIAFYGLKTSTTLEKVPG